MIVNEIDKTASDRSIDDDRRCYVCNEIAVATHTMLDNGKTRILSYLCQRCFDRTKGAAYVTRQTETIDR